MVKTKYQHVKVYQMLRSAHLERAHTQFPASVLYVSERYDFDASLAPGLDLIRAGTFRTAFILFRSRIKVCEINEPLVRARLLRTALAVAAVRMSAALRRDRANVVCYAIENFDPYSRPARTVAGGWRGRLTTVKALLRLQFDRILMRWVAGQVNRIAFGTPGAADLYRRTLGDRLAGATHVTIPALPAPCKCPTQVRIPKSVLFVGAFETRKGFDLLLRAWPSVRTVEPGARLNLIGQGGLLGEAVAFADAHPEVSLLVNPPRDDIHLALRRAELVVLLSQRRPNWREQVGLPLVEALAHGCRVLTTDETGLANWLADHGHRVIDGDADVSAIALAIAEDLGSDLASPAVTCDLPELDGRWAADSWLHRGEPAASSMKCTTPPTRTRGPR